MTTPVGDPRPAGTQGPAGDQRQAGETGPAGDPRTAGTTTDTPAPDPFDPSAHTVDEVHDYLTTATDTEKDRVLAAERDGKSRATLVG